MYDFFADIFKFYVKQKNMDQHIYEYIKETGVVPDEDNISAWLNKKFGKDLEHFGEMVAYVSLRF